MLIIDRFEGEIAVCEQDDRSRIEIPRSELPENACEGDVLVRENGWQIDHDATEARRNTNATRLRSLWKHR